MLRVEVPRRVLQMIRCAIHYTILSDEDVLKKPPVQETAAQFGSPTTGGSINEMGWRFQSCRINDLEMVDQNNASWNQAFSWLKLVEQLRQPWRRIGRISAVWRLS